MIAEIDTQLLKSLPLADLRRQIRDYAAKAPPALQTQADINAELELKDIAERLMCCETRADADRVVSDWLHVMRNPA